ncbi:MAG: hypothetical protein ACD_33C00023G0008 [uncultured bacterium]|nr:MAG: hypothetical protein ACD_33C00023G0008 [uncultured bacterium]
MENNIDLIKEMNEELTRLEMSQVIINYIKSDKLYTDAYGKDYRIQKTLLTMLFYKVIMYSSIVVGKNIRLALNEANDVISWLDDIKLVILPFIKANETKFIEHITVNFGSTH